MNDMMIGGEGFAEKWSWPDRNPQITYIRKPDVPAEI
jgi:hypothetical protein